MSCGVGCRGVSDLALLWLWCRPAAAALIRPLAWESPYAVSAALKRHQDKKKKKKKDVILTSMNLMNMRKILPEKGIHFSEDVLQRSQSRTFSKQIG